MMNDAASLMMFACGKLWGCSASDCKTGAPRPFTLHYSLLPIHCAKVALALCIPFIIIEICVNETMNPFFSKIRIFKTSTK